MILPLRFFQFLHRRFRPALFFPLIGLFCAVHFLFLAIVSCVTLLWRDIILSTLGMTLFFIILRLLDDISDLDFDRKEHPDRPLSCGLMSRREALGITAVLQAVVLGLSFLTHWKGGILAVIILLYQVLSQRDFFLRGARWKPLRLILYSFMVFILSSYLFIMNSPVIFRPGQLLFSGGWWLIMAGIIFAARRRSL